MNRHGLIFGEVIELSKVRSLRSAREFDYKMNGVEIFGIVVNFQNFSDFVVIFRNFQVFTEFFEISRNFLEFFERKFLRFLPLDKNFEKFKNSSSYL